MTNITNAQTPFNQNPSSPNISGPVAQNIPPKNFITPASVTINPNKKSSFGIFVIIGILLIIVIYGVVAYIYFQNQKIKNGGANAKTPSGILSVTPTPAYVVENIKIIDGNVSYLDGNSNVKILVDKSNFTGSGITGFLKLAVSPDKSKICFESWSPAPKPAIYVSNIDGTGASELSPNRKNCTWSSDSKKVLYVNTISSGSGIDIYIYDLEVKVEKNLTFNSPDSATKKKFDIVGLSADGNTLICNFEYLDSEKSGGQCGINLNTLEVFYP